MPIINPKYLMQSVDLSYARYEFYKNEKELIITIDNYKKIFVSQKQFENETKITKKELLEKYNYDKYMEEQRNGYTL